MLRPEPRPNSPPGSQPIRNVGRPNRSTSREATMPMTPGCQSSGVQRFELARQARRLVGIVREQQPQTVVGITDAAGGVQPRREDEPDVPRPQRPAREARGLDQRAQPRPARVGEHLEPVAHEDAVFARQRDDVGDGGEGDVVEEMQRQVLRQGQRLHEGLGELERDPGAAQILVGGGTVGAPRVEHGAGRRQLVAGQVVIGDDHLDPGGPCRPDGCDGGDAAVAGDDEARPHPLGGRQPGGPEVVAVAEAVGDERLDGRAGGAQHARQHRRSALTVHVVVAVHEDRVTGAHRTDHEVQRDPHVRPRQPVAQPGQLGAQERFGGVGSAVPALHEERGEREGEMQLGRQRLRRVRIGRSRDRPTRGRENHSAAYKRTPHASQASIDAPRWTRTRRCVGTDVKQWPQASPWRAYKASGALPRRMRS